MEENEEQNHKRQLSPYLLVILSFLIVIVIGSFLLVSPFAQTSGKWAFNYVSDDGLTKITYLDCLFTSISATCVTGLCTFQQGIGGALTFSGQLIVLILIQIGGLGFITFLTFIVTLIKSKLQFKDRVFLSQAINATNFADVVRFVRRIIVISFVCELLGFLIGLPVAFTIYPHNPLHALWTSLFTSVSAFNNAGFDIFGNTSLIPVDGSIMGLLKENSTLAYYYYLTYIMILVVSGGISFLVIIEIFSKKSPRQFNAFTKIVLSTTAVLLLSGWLAFFLSDGIEHNNRITVFESLFQSVTTRTAGFAIFDQANLSNAGKVVSCVLMFIGGSPLSTAGGIKTTTFFIIILAVYSHLRGKKVVAFNRRYSSETILKGMSLVVLAMFAIVISIISITSFERDNPLATVDIVCFETFSAFGTVGLSANLTPFLSDGSKITLCILMFLGRLGPITFFQVFRSNDANTGHYQYIEEDFLVG